MNRTGKTFEDRFGQEFHEALTDFICDYMYKHTELIMDELRSHSPDNLVIDTESVAEISRAVARTLSEEIDLSKAIDEETINPFTSLIQQSVASVIEAQMRQAFFHMAGRPAQMRYLLDVLRRLVGEIEGLGLEEKVVSYRTAIWAWRTMAGEKQITKEPQPLIEAAS